MASKSKYNATENTIFTLYDKTLRVSIVKTDEKLCAMFHAIKVNVVKHNEFQIIFDTENLTNKNTNTNELSLLQIA